MKILFVTSSYYFIRAFLIPHIKMLVEKGWAVHIASASDGMAVPYVEREINIPIQRTPFDKKNIEAVAILKEEIEREKYDIVHCHTPIGAFVARLAAQKARRIYNTRVVYTAHGFHFYKGAPLKHWMLYYPAEKLLAPLTDALITINDEDAESARIRLGAIKRQYKLPGIGYDTEHIGHIDRSVRDEVRSKYCISASDFVCLYIASFCDRKNHRFLLNNVEQILTVIPECKFVFLGNGENLSEYKQEIDRRGLSDVVFFLGHQSPIADYLSMTDIVVSSSVREGLPMNIIEAMYAALPIVATRISGHTDLIKHRYNGMLYDVDDADTFVRYLKELHDNPLLRSAMGDNAKGCVHVYSVDIVAQSVVEIYNELKG